MVEFENLEQEDSMMRAGCPSVLHFGFKICFQISAFYLDPKSTQKNGPKLISRAPQANMLHTVAARVP